MTVNRQCSSGLQAIANVAAAIKAGFYDIGIAGGVETMSLNGMGWDGGINETAMAHPLASGCYMSMGQTSEAVAERFNVSRKEQDEFAVESHKRAAAAQAAGKFKDQIVPIKVKVILNSFAYLTNKHLLVDTHPYLRLMMERKSLFHKMRVFALRPPLLVFPN